MAGKCQERKQGLRLLAKEKTLENIAKKKPLAIGVLVMSSLLFAISIGLLMGVLGSFIYLIIIFPMIAGIALGHIIYCSAVDLKIKRWGWLLFTSTVSAFVLYWMFHYGKYLVFQAIATYKLFGGFSDKEIYAAKQILEIAFTKETGYGGFIGYLLLVAKKGISIGKIISVSRFTLKGLLAWLYWLVEFGIVAYFTAISAKDATKFKESEDATNVRESEEEMTEDGVWLTD